MSAHRDRFATVGGWDSDDNVFPNYWRRREPKDDAADYIVVTGVSGEVLSPGHDDIVPVLTVTCLAFGEIPEESGWSSAVELMTLESLSDEYVRLSDEDRAALAAAQVASAEAVDPREQVTAKPDGAAWWDEAAGERIGPWRRF